MAEVNISAGPGGSSRKTVDDSEFRIDGDGLFYWEQQPGEPAFWFSRFQRFLLMGPGRNLTALSNAVRADEGKPPLACPTGGFSRNAPLWGWKDRAELFDKYQEFIDLNKWELRRDDVREREWSVGNKLLQKAAEMLEFPTSYQHVKNEKKFTSDDGKTTIIHQNITIEPGKWFFSDVPKMLDVASKLLRLSANLETDRRQPLASLTGAADEQENRRLNAPQTAVFILPDNGRTAGSYTPPPLEADYHIITDPAYVAGGPGLPDTEQTGNGNGNGEGAE